MLEKKNVLGVGITNSRIEEILEYITRGLEKGAKKYYIVTANPEILVLANKNLEYKKILNEAKIAVSDGVGIILAGWVLGRPFKQRLTGIGLLESLCEKVSEKPITVGFLGGRGGVAEKTAECLQKKYPKLKVTFVAEKWIGNKLLRSIRSDILFVAFGAPKQELWISENLDKIPVKVAIGVGGAFDYISERVTRAPSWAQKIGFEWLYRLVRQPWRLKRQLALLEFVFLVLKEKIRQRT